MTTLQVDSLEFSFPVGWKAERYDTWPFFRKQFQRIMKGIKAVDIMAIDPQATLWFIEAKDFRQHPQTNPVTIADQVVGKVLSTLSALLPAKIHATTAEEKTFAQEALKSRKLRVIVHLEQPQKHSKLFPRVIKTEDLCQELRIKLKPIDPHPLVLEIKRMGAVVWKVS